MADKGTPPSPKQFARLVVVATNHWFGGDIDAFCASVGEKSPFHPTRTVLMPYDRIRFATEVFEALGGVHTESRNNFQLRIESEAAQAERNNELQRLAEESLRFVQLQEALGRPPNLKEFGRFDRPAVLAPDVEQAWSIYASAIASALQQGSEASQTISINLPAVEARSQEPVVQSGNFPEINPGSKKRSWLSRLWYR
jgi:hypothetical protein